MALQNTNCHNGSKYVKNCKEKSKVIMAFRHAAKFVSKIKCKIIRRFILIYNLQGWQLGNLRPAWLQEWQKAHLSPNWICNVWHTVTCWNVIMTKRTVNFVQRYRVSFLTVAPAKSTTKLFKASLVVVREKVFIGGNWKFRCELTKKLWIAEPNLQEK